MAVMAHKGSGFFSRPLLVAMHVFSPALITLRNSWASIRDAIQSAAYTVHPPENLALLLRGEPRVTVYL